MSRSSVEALPKGGRLERKLFHLMAGTFVAALILVLPRPQALVTLVALLGVAVTVE